MVISKEAKRLYDKEYRVKNKEKKKEYRAKNKELIKEYNKQYSQTPEAIKSKTVRKWRSRGVVGDLYTLYDEKYLPSTTCEVCNNTYSSTFDRCLDHDHETGEFRQMLCRSCNTRDCWKKIIEIEI